MEKKQIKRATLDDIVRAKLQKEQDALTVKDIEIPSNKLFMQFRRPTRKEICQFMDSVQENSDTEGMLEAYQELLYMCCPMMHEKEVLEGLGVTEPTMSIPAIMDDGDILVVGDEVASMNPLYGRYAEEEKNSSSMMQTC